MVEYDIMAHIMAKPMKTVELHYLIIQFLITCNIPLVNFSMKILTWRLECTLRKYK